MTEYEKLEKAFHIFNTHTPKDDQSIAFEHDVTYAGPDPKTMPKHVIEELKELGWYVDEDFGCFQHFG